ncbi:hypothetical protein F7725_013129 [Dissostichus mawsoni]|uniref:Uncharacterized protein n=1 Tax=Dissostichus mawsoni TaxID=36200 RepID=A0A7J5YSH3_DISMA|nr:hypothetical protein F7725_013129 [Dissostichus mawsoni]
MIKPQLGGESQRRVKQQQQQQQKKKKKEQSGGMRADRVEASSPSCTRLQPPAVHFTRLYEPRSASLSVSCRQPVCRRPCDDKIGQRLAAATYRE